MIRSSDVPSFVLKTIVCATLMVTATGVVGQSTPRFFTTSGTEILNRSGDPVVPKGVGLGGWLVPEGYMLHIQAPDGGSPTSIRSQIEDLIGSVNTALFYQKYEDNYVAEKDIAAIASWGFDHIRLPFHYRLFFDPATETFREEGFALLDSFLDWCRTYGLDVILDMHAAPGAQNDGNISDSDGVARLWTEPVPYQDQTVDIWKEIATRYASDTLIVGFDLINEPVTPDGISGFDLRDLYVRIADSIRTVDPNHILFIEGNFFATHFPELIPPFDDNMVYTFHKYWNGTQINSIQYLLDIRSDTNRPLWLGETGENSNPWFYSVAKLMEQHGIGWNFWTHKKIRTTTSPLSAPFAPGYEQVLDYWRGTAPRPTAEFARSALFAMADGLDLDSCVTVPGVIASLLDPNFGSLRIPVAEHHIPGDISAADYDIGNNGVTYSDLDVMATTGSPGGGNNGTHYRNDGVDIELSTDPQGFPYNVGWTNPFEWLTYTVDVDTTGFYDVEIRVASAGGGGEFDLRIDNAQLGDVITAPDTGGWQNWVSVWLHNVKIDGGQHILKLQIRAGEFNINAIKFTLIEPTAIEAGEGPAKGFKLSDPYPNPFTDEINLIFESDAAGLLDLTIVDILGRTVYEDIGVPIATGVNRLTRQPGLAPGSYFVRIINRSSHGIDRFSAPVVRIR